MVNITFSPTHQSRAVRFGFRYLDKSITGMIGAGYKPGEDSMLSVMTEEHAQNMVASIQSKPFKSLPPRVQIFGMFFARSCAWSHTRPDRSEKLLNELTVAIMESMVTWAEVVPVTPESMAWLQASHEDSLRAVQLASRGIDAYYKSRRDACTLALAGCILLVALAVLMLLT